MKVQRINEGVHALMFIDPGGTTGVAAAHVELLHTLKRTFHHGVRMRKSVEVTGRWEQQGKQLAELINRFYFTAQVEHQIPADRIHVGFENYTRRPQSHDNHLEPVYVTAACVGYLGRDDIEFIYQEPSEGKGFATNDRLKLWGLWKVGSEHERDAWRHLAYRVNRLLG